MAEPEFEYAIVACARWEGPYITEWLSYYQLLGFDHVFLYCNDDDPGPFYERVLPFTLGERPFVTFRYYPEQGRQARMYAHFLTTDLRRCRWVSFFDIDEFLRLPAGQTIGAFMRHYENGADCVLFNWLFFGTGGHKTPPAGPVLENFIRREEGVHCLTKYVARAEVFADPRFLDPDGVHWFWHWPGYVLGGQFRPVNVLHEDMTEYFEGFPERPKLWVNEPRRRDRILEIAAIHHYSFRSEQSFWDREARGLGGEFAPQKNWRNLAEGESFSRYLETINAVEDRSLAGFWAEIRGRAVLEDVTGPPPARLISGGKQATQSSFAQWPQGEAAERDASGAVNGRIDGQAKFYTACEDEPWWQVDLGKMADIEKIRIFNVTTETAGRFKDFAVSVSIDGESWADIVVKRDGAAVAVPYVWEGPGKAWGRFVRITLLGRDVLHLDQVEVYGRAG
jgi:hypothetical protein